MLVAVEFCAHVFFLVFCLFLRKQFKTPRLEVQGLENNAFESVYDGRRNILIKMLSFFVRSCRHRKCNIKNESQSSAKASICVYDQAMESIFFFIIICRSQTQITAVVILS